jgi:signal transduction histidine kinase
MQVDGQRDERTDRLGWTFTRQISLLISETILRADSINKKEFEKSFLKDFFQTQLLNLFDVDYNKLQRRLDNDLT